MCIKYAYWNYSLKAYFYFDLFIRKSKICLKIEPKLIATTKWKLSTKNLGKYFLAFIAFFCFFSQILLRLGQLTYRNSNMQTFWGLKFDYFCGNNKMSKFLNDEIGISSAKKSNYSGFLTNLNLVLCYYLAVLCYLVASIYILCYSFTCIL